MDFYCAAYVAHDTQQSFSGIIGSTHELFLVCSASNAHSHAPILILMGCSNTCDSRFWDSFVHATLKLICKYSTSTHHWGSGLNIELQMIYFISMRSRKRIPQPLSPRVLDGKNGHSPPVLYHCYVCLSVSVCLGLSLLSSCAMDPITKTVRTQLLVYYISRVTGVKVWERCHK